MESPLLERRSSELQLLGEDGDYLPARGLSAWWRIFCVETVKLWRIGGPIAIQIICQYATNSVATIFVGHLGDVELSAFSIAISVVGTFAFGFMLGMGSALETLCGQAFGAGQVHMLGVYMQRSFIVLFCTCVLLLPIYIFATPLLKLLGQPDDIANLSGYFTLLTIPQLFALSVTFPTQKFLQAQSKVTVLAWIAIFNLLAQVFWCWLFIDVFKWGAVGACFAYDVTNWINALAQLIYVIYWCKDGWKGLSWSAFHDIWAFVRLSLESAVMLCLEIWYLMSIIVLAGNLKDAVTAVGALAICMNIDGIETMLFIGVNAAISVRVSNELGLGRPRAAKYSVYVTIFQSLLIGILCMIVILATRNYFAIIFTDSETMQRAVYNLSALLGITMLLNSIQPVISGVAIGGGWQGIVAYINLGSYYIFGLPLGYILGYVANFGVKGIWSGMIAGVALQTLLLFIVLYRTNWNKEVEQTTERMRKWGGQDPNQIVKNGLP
ncbi:protein DETOXIFICATION 35-like [Andrographis paniculata]|uniref:protein DETOXIFICATION 35-like n=1 Tax=Andrographis paniculata TaxID=175694 RepID=UPI0021E81C3B|nr:protein DETOXIFICATION 35-like [Andrographis paniculata]XP_051137912.1 protein DETOXIFICATION 35-like [Andrographis paniculata]